MGLGEVSLNDIRFHVSYQSRLLPSSPQLPSDAFDNPETVS
jgi:hypothetical protein